MLSQFEGDAEEFLFQRFQDELIDQLKKPLNLGYEKILLEITQNQEELRRSTPVLELPQYPAAQFEELPQPNPLDNEIEGSQSRQQQPSSSNTEVTRTTTTNAARAQPGAQPAVAPPSLEQLSPQERQACCR